MTIATKRRMIEAGLAFALRYTKGQVIAATYFTASLLFFCGMEESEIDFLILAVFNLAISTYNLNKNFKSWKQQQD